MLVARRFVGEMAGARLTSGLRPRQPPPDFRSLGPPRFDPVAVGLATHNDDTPKPAAPRKYAESMPDVDPREVFVVVGRNTEANTAMFTFLRAINLRPIEWSTAIAATGSRSPYIGDALEAAFARAKAVVVFMTPDDVAQIRPEYASGPDDPELKLTPQANRTCFLKRAWRWDFTATEQS